MSFVAFHLLWYRIQSKPIFFKMASKALHKQNSGVLSLQFQAPHLFLPPRLMPLFLLLGLLECLTLPNTYFSCSLKLCLLWRLCICPFSAQMELTQLEAGGAAGVGGGGGCPFKLANVLNLKCKHTWNILVHIHEYLSGPTHCVPLSPCRETLRALKKGTILYIPCIPRLEHRVSHTGGAL